eukprot:jgi/Chlat1/1001/Chrsp108S01398
MLRCSRLLLPRLTTTTTTASIRLKSETFSFAYIHADASTKLSSRPAERQAQRLLVVQPRRGQGAELRGELEEALRLAESLSATSNPAPSSSSMQSSAVLECPHVLVQNPAGGHTRTRRVRSNTFFGSGTVDEVKRRIDSLPGDKAVKGVFVNAPLTAVQQRNLESRDNLTDQLALDMPIRWFSCLWLEVPGSTQAAWGMPVVDRVGLIIEIFASRAQTREAKLQVELAALEYKASRLVRSKGPGRKFFDGVEDGAASEVVSARQRGAGGLGFMGGAGETEIELQRRRLGERKRRLLELLGEVRRTRQLQRTARQRQGDVAQVAVVGYTNAGKSSLVTALSKRQVGIEDRLFSTLDPSLRGVRLPSGRRAVLSDTVGFISDLPVQLVDAFRATLEEVTGADLLLHVIDASARARVQQRDAVLSVLRGLGVEEDRLKTGVIEVWNKVDLIHEQEEPEDNINALGASVVADDSEDGKEDRHSEQEDDAGRDSESSVASEQAEESADERSAEWGTNGGSRLPPELGPLLDDVVSGGAKRVDVDVTDPEEAFDYYDRERNMVWESGGGEAVIEHEEGTLPPEFDPEIEYDPPEGLPDTPPSPPTPSTNTDTNLNNNPDQDPDPNTSTRHTNASAVLSSHLLTRIVPYNSSSIPRVYVSAKERIGLKALLVTIDDRLGVGNRRQGGKHLVEEAATLPADQAF